MGSVRARTARLRALIPALFALLTASVATSYSQESASFVMDRVTISSTADSASSAGFEMSVTFGQEGPVGSVSVCGDGAFQSTGFWSIVGDPPAPIILGALQKPGDPSAVDLFWTGSAGQFELFRSEMADSVGMPASSLLTTSLCAASDAPPEGDIFYYMVLPAGK